MFHSRRFFSAALVLSGALVLATAFGAGEATAAERVVLGESFVNTECSYCPYAEAAVNRLLNDYPDTFIDLQNHLWDDYETDWTAERANFYGVEGTPTTWFDGIDEASGAFTNDNQMYNWYLAKINQRLEVPTDVSVSLSAEQLNDDTYHLTATVTMDPEGEQKALQGHIVQVIDYYPAAEDDRYRNTVIQQQESEPFTLEPGATYEFSQEFTLSGDSFDQRENVKFVVWVNDRGVRAPLEAHNASQLVWPFVEEQQTCSTSGSRGLPAWALMCVMATFCPLIRRRRRG